MNETIWIAILTALTGIVGGSFGAAWLQRQKTEAETGVAHAQQQISLAAEAMNIMKATLDNTVAPLHRRIDEMELENTRIKEDLICQAETLENLNAQVLKLQLAFVVNESFIKSIGHTPPVSLRDLDGLSTAELQDIAMSMRNVADRTDIKRGNREKKD